VFHVVIPARFASSRLPGKPLLTIAGRPLLQWVWQSAVASGARSVSIATDDERIVEAARRFGANCVMTSAAHLSGTDRIAEVLRGGGFVPDDVVVNLQGDEPLMPGTVIGQVAAAVLESASIDIASAVAPIGSMAEFLDPNHVKAVMDEHGRALYFSRAPIPWPRDQMAARQPPDLSNAWRHVGIYAYRVRSLLQFAAWAPTGLENVEKLEQLRALEHGMHIRLVRLRAAPPAGVDTAEDLQRVRAVLGGE
jgi:3-deoxy-manno-octulosonate cytidylyltransferase (CMP-KDO synthetase)